MTNQEHSTITDPNIHEPKGCSSAAANTVYQANGSGSGAWVTYDKSYPLTTVFIDIGTPGSKWVTAPYAGTIRKIYLVHDLTTNTADTIISFSIGGVGVTNGNITVTNGSVAGTVGSSTPSANNVVTAGQAIQITAAAGTANHPNAHVVFDIVRT